MRIRQNITFWLDKQNNSVVYSESNIMKQIDLQLSKETSLKHNNSQIQENLHADKTQLSDNSMKALRQSPIRVPNIFEELITN